MDWIEFWAKFGSGLLGALIGGSAISALNGYYSKKGERKLLREELPNILAEERERAFQQEKGKRLATHEDINNVLAEVRAVTRETESIKGQIGVDSWTRQTIWTQQRDLYAQTFEALNDFRHLIVRDAPNEIWKGEYQAMLGHLRRLLALAHIFVGESGRRSFSDFYGRVIELNSFEGFGAIVNKFELLLISAARRDLGVNAEMPQDVAAAGGQPGDDSSPVGP